MEVPKVESSQKGARAIVISGLGLLIALIFFYFTESFDGKIAVHLLFFITLVSFWSLYCSFQKSKTFSAIGISLAEHPNTFTVFQVMYSASGFYCLIFGIYRLYWYGN